MMNKRNIILDCDPGHDDAIAILMAASSDKLNLLGITIESGNQTLEKTGRNALNICSYLGIDVPVCLGESHPLKREPMICGQIHGESGLDGFTFPAHNKTFDKRDAITFIHEMLHQYNNVTLVPTGPLTNIAKLLLAYPNDINFIEEIVLMGGSIMNGNVSPAAEFNILCDPEAAEIVFNTGKVKMMGLDVTRKVLVLPSIVERMKKINNKASEMFVALMKTFNENQRKVFGLEAGPLHDPVTIVYLIDESVVKLQKMNVEIDVSGGPSYGRTNCDIFDYLHRNKNAYVAVDIDVNKYWDNIERGLSKFN